MTNEVIGIILLAAGESARLGEPKQLLQLNGESFLRRSVKTALAVSNSAVVTLGARSVILQKEVEDLPVQIVDNKDWKSGMSSSIKIGLEILIQSNKSLEGVLIMVCDQPFVDTTLLWEIVEKFNAGETFIVACEYEKTLGVPAIFHRSLFPELLALDDKIGARQIIKKYREKTSVINFPHGAFDIDTPADYAKLLEKFKR